jgi:hypothetical protein
MIVYQQTRWTTARFDKHSLSRYDGLKTEQEVLVFISLDVNLCTAMVIELIVFSYNEVIVQ